MQVEIEKIVTTIEEVMDKDITFETSQATDLFIHIFRGRKNRIKSGDRIAGEEEWNNALLCYRLLCQYNEINQDNLENKNLYRVYNRFKNWLDDNYAISTLISYNQ